MAGHEWNFGEKFTKACVILNRVDKLIEHFDDKVIHKTHDFWLLFF